MSPSWVEAGGSGGRPLRGACPGVPGHCLAWSCSKPSCGLQGLGTWCGGWKASPCWDWVAATRLHRNLLKETRRTHLITGYWAQSSYISVSIQSGQRLPHIHSGQVNNSKM